MNAGGWILALVERCYKDRQRHQCNRRFNVSGTLSDFAAEFLL
jgi:hypothetical protein